MSDYAFSLDGARLSRDERAILSGLSFKIAGRGVTVIVGPSATGKSSLLHSLAVGPFSSGLSREGSWRYRGEPIEQTDNRVAILSQRPRASLDDLNGILSSAAADILLDEPDRIEGVDLNELKARLRARAEHGACVLVTHNVQFACDIADEMIMLCAGEMLALGPPGELREHPPNELVKRYFRDGNFWPPPAPPQLPPSFYWVEPKQLAGVGKPGLMRPLEEDLEALATAGVDFLVTLTKERLPQAYLSPFGIRNRHFPIEDMGVPGKGPTIRLCREVERHLETGGGVAFHCHAGLGRTGTLLACYLVFKGASAEDAIAKVRAACPQAIQSRSQVDFIRFF